MSQPRELTAIMVFNSYYVDWRSKHTSRKDIESYTKSVDTSYVHFRDLCEKLMKFRSQGKTTDFFKGTDEERAEAARLVAGVKEVRTWVTLKDLVESGNVSIEKVPEARKQPSTIIPGPTPLARKQAALSRSGYDGAWRGKGYVGKTYTGSTYKSRTARQVIEDFFEVN